MRYKAESDTRVARIGKWRFVICKCSLRGSEVYGPMLYSWSVYEDGGVRARGWTDTLKRARGCLKAIKEQWLGEDGV